MVEPEIFFSVTPAAQAWHDAMQQQTAHEAVCSPCRLTRTPACDEGEQLMEAARDAHAEWAAGEYVPLAVQP